jgi:tRNA threonylcarbamoyladenosine biosynthesis protein TsaB
MSMTMPLTHPLRILAFDTSTRRGSVALLEETELQAELKLQRIENHSANLIPAIDFLLKGAGWELADIGLVATGTGPGSFTGIRIGIATGLGIAQSLAIPFAGITGLEALACQAASLRGRLGVVMNAQREQAYYAEYDLAGGKIHAMEKPSLVGLSELDRKLYKRHIYVTGDPEVIVGRVTQNAPRSWPRFLESDPYLAVHIGRRAASVKRRWRKGDYIQCEPLYIRPPDAVRKRSEIL